MEQKMVLASYGSGGSITVLTSTQVDIAAKVITILSPIEKNYKRNISWLKYNISDYTSSKGLIKVLEKQDEDHGVRAMKRKMLESLKQATILDKDRFFTSSMPRKFYCLNILIFLETMDQMNWQQRDQQEMMMVKTLPSCGGDFQRLYQSLRCQSFQKKRQK